MKIKNLHLRIFALILSTSATLFTSCKKETPVKPQQNALTGFNILKSDGTAFDKDDISISIAADSISVTVPIFTDVTNLIPDLKTDAGVSVTPANRVKNNFTQPVTYSITAADGTVKKYKVIVHHDKLKNVVYVGGGNKNLYALNTNTGTLIWKYTAQGGLEYSSPVLVNGILYIGSVDHNMYALDPVTGALKWKFTTQSSIMSVPAVANGIVYFGSDDSYVYAVDALTGTLKWKYKTGFNADTDPLVKNGVLYMGSGDGKLYALNALSGNLKWSFNTGNLLIDWRILESNGAVFIGGRSGVLYALNESDGSVKWSASVGGGNTLERSKIVINNGVIYITDGAYGSLRAIKESDGSLIWKSLDNLGFWSGPSLANGFLYVSSNDNNFYIINAATGAVIIKKTLITNGALAAIADGKIFVAAGGENFFCALDAVTANTIWKFPLPESILNSRALVVDKNGNW